MYYALMSGKGVRIAHNNFDTGVIQLFKNVDLPYEMKYDPEVPFNTLFMSQSRHFAMLGIDKSLASYLWVNCGKESSGNIRHEEAHYSALSSRFSVL